MWLFWWVLWLCWKGLGTFCSRSSLPLLRSVCILDHTFLILLVRTCWVISWCLRILAVLPLIWHGDMFVMACHHFDPFLCNHHSCLYYFLCHCLHFCHFCLTNRQPGEDLFLTIFCLLLLTPWNVTCLSKGNTKWSFKCVFIAWYTYTCVYKVCVLLKCIHTHKGCTCHNERNDITGHQ